MSDPRQAGFYWVKVRADHDWEIARWDGTHWFTIVDDDPRYGFDTISDKVMTPEEIAKDKAKTVDKIKAKMLERYGDETIC